MVESLLEDQEGNTKLSVWMGCKDANSSELSQNYICW